MHANPIRAPLRKERPLRFKGTGIGEKVNFLLDKFTLTVIHIPVYEFKGCDNAFGSARSNGVPLCPSVIGCDAPPRSTNNAVASDQGSSRIPLYQRMENEAPGSGWACA